MPFVPYARLGGSDGMRLSRAAFAVMIKFSELFEDFISIVDDMEMKIEEIDGDQASKDQQLKEHIRSLPKYD